MKNKIIRACAVILALIVVSLVAVGTVLNDNSNYYEEYAQMILEHPFKTVLYDRPIWEYYSKTPSWFKPENHWGDDLFKNIQSEKMSIARATFLSEKCGRGEISYSFHINDWIRKRYESQSRNVTLFRKEYDYYVIYGKQSDKRDIYTSHRNEYQLMLSYYNAEYEKGNEYLLVYNHSSRQLGHFYYFAPLDGEYPYIEVYPGATRYDATYFGAESKYVSKDEFVSLVKEAINALPVS